MEIKTEIFNYEKIENIKVTFTITKQEFEKLRSEYGLSTINRRYSLSDKPPSILQKLIHDIQTSISEEQKKKKVELIEQLEKEGLITKNKKSNFWSFLNGK